MIRQNKKYEGIKVDKIGIRREMDKVARVCIPVEMRRLFKLEDEIELQVTKHGILLRNPEYILVKREDSETKG